MFHERVIGFSISDKYHRIFEINVAKMKKRRNILLAKKRERDFGAEIKSKAVWMIL